MGKLMKYEFRKTWFSKLVILLITGFSELLFLVGVIGKMNNIMYYGVTGLTLSALIGIFYIGIESLMVFHRDLNTKQSYMLFLTPNSSRKILGAKILENGIAIFAAGCFFSLLALADISFSLAYQGGFKELVSYFSRIITQFRLDFPVTKLQGFMVFMTILCGWLMMIVNGHLAILISSTFLAGKKMSGFVSFLLYLAIAVGCSYLLKLVPSMNTMELQMGANIAGTLILTALLYFVSCWIMDSKLSV